MQISRRIISCLLILSILCSFLLLSAFSWDHREPDPAYETLFPIPSYTPEDGLYALSEPTETYLNGKSILLVGDSLLAGYGLSDYSQSWCGMLESQYGMEITTRAVSGSTFSVGGHWGYQPGGYYYPICQRTLPEGDFDVVFVTGSGNDWYCEIPLGTSLSSRDTTTLMGAVNTTIDRLQQLYPEALILFSTSWNSTGAYNGLGLTTADYNRTLLSVCQARGIPCFQACDPSLSGIDSTSSTFRAQYFLTATDYWHLSPAGHRKYLPIIAGWLEETLLEETTVSGFFDVKKTAWYADAVQYASDRGLVRGVTAVSFSPEGTMSRCMLLTILYRAAGSPDVSGLSLPFEDVNPQGYYYSALLWGFNSGLVRGMDETHFAPDAPVTREQLATFLYRFAQAEGTDYLPDDLSRFTDRSMVSSYARRALSWAVGMEILQGMGDGTLAPQAEATRAQTVQLLTNYFRNSSGV